jgi:4-amino-4-deoxy-L-arabinose transferase-like glycosyltransferase
LAGFGGIHPDEAYYWTWSQHLRLGYFDHPPMIAWLIRLGEWIQNILLPRSMIAGDPGFYARTALKLVPSFLSSVITPLLMARTIELVQKQPLRLSQLAVLLTLPIFIFGPQIVTPDAPFFMAWAWVLMLSVQLLRSRAGKSVAGDSTPFSWKISLTAGIALAFAAYSKYTALLAAFLFVIAGAGIYNSVVACLVAFVLTAPYFVWTYDVGMTQGAGVFFQFQHGLGSATSSVNYKRMGDLVASQIFMWGPLVFLGALLAPLMDFRKLFVPQRKSFLVGSLFMWAFFPLIFFALNALKRPAEANWPLMGALAASVLVLARLRKHVSWLVTLFLLNVVLCLLAAALITQAGLFVPLAKQFSPRLAEKLKQPSRLQEFQRWDRLHEVMFEATRLETLPVEVQSYQVLSELLFADSYARAGERFGDRLKIWAEGSRMSEFQRHTEFLNDNEAKPYWLVMHNADKAPGECFLQQTVFKSPAEPEPFSIYRCNF